MDLDASQHDDEYDLTATETQVTDLSILLDGGDGSRPIEVDLYIPRFFAGGTAGSREFNFGLTDIGVNPFPGDVVSLENFDLQIDADGEFRHVLFHRAIIPAFVGTKTLVPLMTAEPNLNNVSIGAQIGSPGSNASLIAHFIGTP